MSRVRSTAAVTLIPVFLVACSGGYTQEEVDEAVSDALAAQQEEHQEQVTALEDRLTEVERQLSQATSTTVSSAPNLYQVVTQHVSEDYVEGDSEYVAINIDGFLAGLVEDALLELGFPPGTWARVQNTRALDGTQTARGDGIVASWTYHPDSGLNMVIERTD